MTTDSLVLVEADPFELPEWLGTDDVVWQTDLGLRSGHLVPGRLTHADHVALDCDLLAVDRAYPTPACDEAGRTSAHQLWERGEILIADVAGRLILAAPGTAWDAELVLEALARLARAVGGNPARFAATLRVGEPRKRRPRR